VLEVVGDPAALQEVVALADLVAVVREREGVRVLLVFYGLLTPEERALAVGSRLQEQGFRLVEPRVLVPAGLAFRPASSAAWSVLVLERGLPYRGSEGLLVAAYGTGPLRPVFTLRGLYGAGWWEARSLLYGAFGATRAVGVGERGATVAVERSAAVSAEELLEAAVRDAEEAEEAYNRGSWSMVCFHAQQACEKMLKAFIASRRRYPATHSLTELLLVAAEVDPSLASLAPQARVLERHYEASRYPEAARRLNLVYDRSVAEECLDALEAFRSALAPKIEESRGGSQAP